MSPGMIYAFEYHLPERFPPSPITKGCSKTEFFGLACETCQVKVFVPIRVFTWKDIRRPEQKKDWCLTISDVRFIGEIAATGRISDNACTRDNQEMSAVLIVFAVRRPMNRAPFVALLGLMV
jgi:hypothetical protein